MPKKDKPAVILSKDIFDDSDAKPVNPIKKEKIAKEKVAPAKNNEFIDTEISEIINTRTEKKKEETPTPKDSDFFEE